MHVIDSLPIGGAERMLVTLVNSVDRQIVEPSVCITREGLTLVKEILSDIPVIELKRRNRFDPVGFVKLREYSLKQKVDLYHAHGRSTFSFLLAAKKLGFITAPILLHDHYGDIEMDQYIPGWFKLIGCQGMAYYVGVYKKLADWALKAGVPTERVTWIGNALELQRIQSYSPLNLHEMFQVPLERKIGILIGNIRPAKGLDLLIESLSKCNTDVLPVIIVVGKLLDSEYSQKCFENIKLAKLKDSFRFVGQQANSLSWMKGADFGIMSSRSESGPLVLIEMMACGLPIAAFNVGDISNTVSQALPTSFVQPGDTQGFARLLEKLNACSSEEMREMGAHVKKIAYQSFDIESKLPQWYAIYHTAMEKKL